MKLFYLSLTLVALMSLATTTKADIPSNYRFNYLCSLLEVCKTGGQCLPIMPYSQVLVDLRGETGQISSGSLGSYEIGFFEDEKAVSEQLAEAWRSGNFGSYLVPHTSYEIADTDAVFDIYSATSRKTGQPLDIYTVLTCSIKYGATP
jgi:hypothetical protein